jgi:hypothetical protein
MKATLAKMGWEIMNHPPHSLDLAPRDFQVFGPMRVHLGQKFQTDKLICSVLNSLHSQDDTFLLASGTCQDAGRNVLVQTENILKMRESFGILACIFFLFKKSGSTLKHPHIQVYNIRICRQ